MTREEMETLARRYFEIVSRGDIDALEQMLSPDFVQHTRGLPPGPAAAKATLGMFRRGFPDFAVTVDWLLVDGDRVVIRSRAEGTHDGLFMGHPPSGRRFSATGIDVLRFADGRLVERWNEFDTFSMLQQLALVPVPWQTAPRAAGVR
jgi:steroid delta-isomerase-like uncharacterized protein